MPQLVFAVFVPHSGIRISRFLFSMGFPEYSSEMGMQNEGRCAALVQRCLQLTCSISVFFMSHVYTDKNNVVCTLDQDQMS